MNTDNLPAQQPAGLQDFPWFNTHVVKQIVFQSIVGSCGDCGVSISTPAALGYKHFHQAFLDHWKVNHE